MDIKEMLNKGLAILEQDLEHLQEIVGKSALNNSQSKNLNDSIRTLIMANKALSEQSKREDEELESMSEEELKALAEELLKDRK